ncbi:hypothetical protein SYNGFB01_11650 [Synechococcus sp. GFB01]|nr:hypothetical protein SYNGFB01_11650 [Synechococcus sp. GFB01]
MASTLAAAIAGQALSPATSVTCSPVQQRSGSTPSTITSSGAPGSFCRARCMARSVAVRMPSLSISAAEA